jgi:uncharacterized membrane protein YhaH (DUF805 family)
MSAKYFYTIRGVRQDPATIDELKSLATRQELKRSDLLWTEGMSAWQRAGLTPAIFEGLPPDLDPAEQTTSPPPLPENAQNSPNTWGLYLQALKKYTEINGRATRREFWTFFLVSIAIEFVLGCIEGLLDIPGIVSGLYSFAVLMPMITAGVRRMHDTGRSGWWVLLPIGNIIFWVEEGNPGPNKFGPNPKSVMPSSSNRSENACGVQ